MFELKIKRRARVNIEKTAQFYEERQNGLGDRFSKEVHIYLEKIQENPSLFAIKRKNYREAVIQKFPYVIIFEIIESSVIVYSIFHTSRNPNKKP